MAKHKEGVSIVIPFKNNKENSLGYKFTGEYLRNLLLNLRNQTFARKLEIIVADADPSEVYRKMVEQEFQGIYIRGGKASIGKNNGVKAAKNNKVICCDSDLILPVDFVEKAYNVFSEKNLLAAGFYLKYLPTGSLLDDLKLKIASFFQNMTFRFAQNMERPAAQAVMMFDRNAFLEVDGFDTIFAEEGDILMRLKRKFPDRKYRMISESGKAIISARRFYDEGFYKYTLKSLKLLLRTYKKGEKVSDVEYFGNS